MASIRHRPKPPATGKVDSRLARRERRRERSREEILDAARHVLFQNSVPGTTLEAVAKQAGMSKAGLYYYYPSKDALLFELVFGAFEVQARAVSAAVEKTNDGGKALRAIIRATVQAFASSLDDFRLAFLFGQVAAPGAVHWDEQQFARIRPLNELCFAGAAKRLAEERDERPGRAQVEPRLMAFLAYLAAIGLLTMKGMVQSLEDPLVYSDEQLVEGLARIFEAAAAP